MCLPRTENVYNEMPEAIFGTRLVVALLCIYVPDGEPRGMDGDAMPLFTAPQAHLTSQNLKRGRGKLIVSLSRNDLFSLLMFVCVSC